MTDKELIIPNHIGIIMDGNGRWATKRGLKRSAGHKEGAKTLKKLLNHIYKRGVKFLSLYAFSTDNFKRSKEEVDYLMNLFIEMFKKQFKDLEKNNIKVLFSGRRYPLPKEVLDAMDEMSEKTKNNTNGTLNICLNYGGQEEIVDMVKKIIDKKIDSKDITKELVNENLYQDLPPVDFIIRTSGEKRISNFLLWQSSYAEYHFPKVLFPDFKEKEFDEAIIEFNKRKRRFGGYSK
ncbi:MAG: polyprenyl diphosphate synthase [Bacilli bacterium]